MPQSETMLFYPHPFYAKPLITTKEVASALTPSATALTLTLLSLDYLHLVQRDVLPPLLKDHVGNIIPTVTAAAVGFTAYQALQCAAEHYHQRVPEKLQQAAPFLGFLGLVGLNLLAETGGSFLPPNMRAQFIRHQLVSPVSGLLDNEQAIADMAFGLLAGTSALIALTGLTQNKEAS